MRLYEIAVVLHPDLEIDLDNASAKVEKIISTNKGKVVKKDNWGKRKLAYKIKKQDWGIYIFYQVELEPTAVAKIDSSLRITEEVMRYLVVSLDHIRYIRKSDEAKKASQIEEASKVPEKTEVKSKTDDKSDKTTEEKSQKTSKAKVSKEETK